MLTLDPFFHVIPITPKDKHKPHLSVCRCVLKWIVVSVFKDSLYDQNSPPSLRSPPMRGQFLPPPPSTHFVNIQEIPGDTYVSENPGCTENTNFAALFVGDA